MERINVESTGERLDVYLTKHFAGLYTRSQILNAVKRGLVVLNGLSVKAGTILTSGDIIEFNLDNTTSPAAAEPEDIALDIVFEDEHLMIINKPRGMVVHPGAGNGRGTLLNALLYRFAHSPEQYGEGKDTAGAMDRAGIVHRLDKNTAGLMVVAKSALVQARLGDMFAAHAVKRTYVGLVEGVVSAANSKCRMLCDGGVISGTIDTNIIRDPNNRTLYKSVESRPPNALNNSAPAKGRRAVTHFRVLQSFSRHTLVEFRLETGRTHQIRVHAKSIGHPLAADPEYNPRGSLKPTGQLLESVEIDFIHPVTGARVHHKIPLGPEFQAVLSRLTRK